MCSKWTFLQSQHKWAAWKCRQGLTFLATDWSWRTWNKSTVFLLLSNQKQTAVFLQSCSDAWQEPLMWTARCVSFKQGGCDRDLLPRPPRHSRCWKACPRKPSAAAAAPLWSKAATTWAGSPGAAGTRRETRSDLSPRPSERRRPGSTASPFPGSAPPGRQGRPCEKDQQQLKAHEKPTRRRQPPSGSFLMSSELSNDWISWRWFH